MQVYKKGCLSFFLGASASANIYSLVETAKANGLEQFF